MKLLQWFPGHMAKAMRMMEENVALCDGIIYVLDARCPAASFNTKLKKMFGAKPVLYVLNKGDLADGGADAFVRYIRDCGAEAVRLNATDSRSRRNITGAMAKLVAEKRQKNLDKGYVKTFRFMVCGVPNTGKSTGPHLHYEVHVKGRVVNPVNYYFMDLSAEDYDRMIQLAENHGKVLD